MNSEISNVFQDICNENLSARVILYLTLQLTLRLWDCHKLNR